jgi:non-heme chloroperoxidase
VPYLSAPRVTDLYYRDHGDGQPVVFLASQGLSGQMWQPLTARLTGRGLRCVALDRRGHGRSDDPGRGFDYDTLADDVDRLLTGLDLQDVTLVGHSLGGGEAVRYLTRHGRGRVSRLVLASATLPFLMKTADNPLGVDAAVFESLWEQWRTDWPHWIAENAPPFAGAGLPGCSVSPEQLARGIRDMEQTSLLALLGCSESVFTTDFRAELTRLELPTLIIHGDRDVSAPVELTGARTAELMPTAEFRLYEHAPHGLVVTHPRQFEADLVDFIKA